MLGFVITGHPLNPDAVVFFDFGKELLQATAVELKHSLGVLGAQILLGLVDEVLRDVNHLDALEVAEEEMLADAANARSAVNR